MPRLGAGHIAHFGGPKLREMTVGLNGLHGRCDHTTVVYEYLSDESRYFEGASGLCTAGDVENVDSNVSVCKTRLFIPLQ